MLNMVKKIAKVLKGINRPNFRPNAKPAVSHSNVTPAKVLAMPNREELLTRFTDAVAAYPCRYEIDEWMDSDSFTTCPAEIENLVFSLEALGFDVQDWLWGGYEYDALCAAIEYEQQWGKEITLEVIAEVFEAIDDGKYTFFPNVEYDEDLGGEILDAFQNSGKHYGLGWLIEAVDCEILGERWRNEEGGIYTTRGYFQFGKLEF